MKQDDETNDESFNASRAEIFEALGHPTRIRLLQCLAEKPLTFSELKRAAGLEGNGVLSFHLGKLGGLVRVTQEGSYALTDEGKEALRMVEASKNDESKPVSSSIHPPSLKAILAGLVVVLIVLATASAIEYDQLQNINSKIQYSSTTVLQTTTTTYTSTTTVVSATTTTSTITHTVGGGIQASSVGNTIWSFSAFLTSDSVAQGEPLQLTAILTNINPASQNITDFVQPTIYPTVYSSNGTMLWTWEPPQVTWPNRTISSGQSLTLQSLSIPTTQLSINQTYSIRIDTLSIPTAMNLSLTLQFQITSPTTVTTTSSSSQTQLYDVTFQQSGACSPSVYVAPWSVTLNGTTKVEPPGGSVSTGGGYSAGPEPSSVYTIVFTVPDGVYHYVLAPQGAFYTFNGNITVNGSNLTVIVDGPVVSCTTTTNIGGH